jgi:hypothetical protein
MLKPFRKIILAAFMANILLALLFVYGNYGIWSEFNNYNGLSNVRMTPIWIQDYHAGGLSNGNFIATGAFVLMANTPFWIYFVSTATNLIIIFYLITSKETKKNPA